MKKLLSCLVIMIFFFAIHGCVPTPIATNPFANACQSPSMFSAGAGNVFIADIFTPNADGVNDLLGVFPKNIKYIVNGVIKDMNNNVLKNIDTIWGNGNSKYWDGRDASNNLYSGVFQFTCIAIDSNNIAITISTKPCVYDCANASTNATGINKNNCDLADEYEPNVGLPILPTNESCF